MLGQGSPFTMASDYETAKELILQEWKGFGFKFIEKPDYSKVLHQLHENYYLDEPINKLTGMTPERMFDMDDMYKKVMDLNHGSFYAYPVDNPDEVAGVLLIWFQIQGQTFPTCKIRSPITHKVNAAFTKLISRFSFEKEFNVESYPEIFIISTDKLYRGKGLALEMCRKAVEKFKLQKLPLVSSTFTNPISRKIGTKLGFKQVSRLDLDEVTNEDGSLAFGEDSKGQYVIDTVLLLK